MTTPDIDHDFLASARRTLSLEQNALGDLSARLDAPFTHACQHILKCRGRVVVTGVGKSGHVGRKIAATLASTGTPSFFVHAGEASHGDLGMLVRDDLVLALSNSGETAELTALLPLFKRMGTTMIAMTGNVSSSLARHADVHLDVSVAQEACPLNLAPTSSTTATLALGDALAIALLEARRFSPEDFALSHPGGTLGKRLLLRVEDLMHTGDELPVVRQDARLGEALIEMTRKGHGFTCVTDDTDRLVGIYTDGDLRRTIDRHGDVRQLMIHEVMTPGGRTIEAQTLAAEAVRVMEDHRITALVIVDAQHQPTGLLKMHDLLRSGIV
ncbi:KpsF/GutQ family sugar-phosphate isomerase [Kushneria marisflavi]|uniref:Arabinose 5-phosphate isomerase n=1 Tax=Kushneria marisflavi TaxID=157779 RepID=A0A240URZ5_9GAMM|nr:KpsF/GutQ family sugar-phosphate isomerase [Kushneria marisflavi]ART64248.1 D-arabinose 5-phosphate isomerase [Kushneria marisflavi]RKD76710.1 arabinose-5-phosphate isomerase [Kushneria marisflavi]